MAALNRLRDWLGAPARSYPLEQYIADTSMLFNGHRYPILNQTLPGENEEYPDASFAGYVQAAYQRNGVVFACMLARLLLFSEARFQFRQRSSGRPGKLFGTPELAVLETPWPNGTTGDLLTRAIQDADLCGNAYFARRKGGLRRMRPDWVTIVLGSPGEDPDSAAASLDTEVLGYLYTPGGPRSGNDPVALLPGEVCHFAPIPDPAARFRGMSWLTPIIRELMADNAMTTHKLRFHEKGATVNLVVKTGLKDAAKFAQYVDLFKRHHQGDQNAYETLFLAEGAEATPIGADMQQIDFKVVQGAGETRIAAAAGVPPIIVGLSEGLASATYSNYGQARRRFADGTMRPLWRNMAASLSTVITVPTNAELWYDDRDIPFLQEDLKDAADIQQTQASTLQILINSGFDPDTAVAAVVAGDLAQLKHTQLVSVQLQPPGTLAAADPAAATNGAALNGKPTPALPPARAVEQLVSELALRGREDQ